MLLPDGTELLRAEKLFGPSLALLDGVSLGALSGTRRGDLVGGLSDFFFGKAGAPAEVLTAPADVYLVVNLSVRVL